MKNMLRKLFDGTFILDYAFKFTANDYLLIIILNIDSTVWKIEGGNKQIQKFTRQ